MKKATLGLLALVIGCNDVPLAPDAEDSNITVLNQQSFFWPGDTVVISSPVLRNIELVPVEANEFDTMGPWRNVSVSIGHGTDVPLSRLDDSTVAAVVPGDTAGLLELTIRIDSTIIRPGKLTIGGVVRVDSAPYLYALALEPGRMVLGDIVNPPQGIRIGDFRGTSPSWSRVNGSFYHAPASGTIGQPR